MRTITIIAMAFALTTALTSCQKQEPSTSIPENGVPIPIQFTVDGGFTAHQGFTRSVSESTISTLETSGMYVTATRGKRGTNETVYMPCVKHNVAGNASTSSYFWPSEENGRLSFYALNLEKTPVAATGNAGVTVQVSPSDGDVIAAFADSLATAHGGSVNLEFHHVLARLYDVKLSTQDAAARASISAITVTPTWNDGNYDFISGKVTGAAAGTSQSISTASNLEINSTPKSVGQSGVDRLMVEGNVTVQITYTLKRNGYEATMTKTGVVNLPAGQKTTISGVLSDDAQGIVFTVTVQPWSEAEIAAELS